MLPKFLRFIVLLFILVCILDLLIQTSWSSKHELTDEVSAQPNSVVTVVLEDCLLTLPADLMPVVFNYFDDESLSRITKVSKKYKNFENLTESIFQQRSDFKEVLPLVFPEGNSWEHSYLLRKGFWDLVINYRDHYHQSISNEERKNVERFARYCKTYNFIVTDLVYFILKILPCDFKNNLIHESELEDRSVNSEEALNHLTTFDKNLTEAISNQNLMGLEVSTTLRILGISLNVLSSDIEKFFYLESGPLEDDSSFNCYKILYQKCPNLFKSISQKSTLNIEKAAFIYDLVEGRCENYKTALNFYHSATKDNCSIAQYNIGRMYQQGHGLAQNYRKSFAWLYKSANQGYEVALNNLGLAYQYGQGIRQDYEKAFDYFLKSANQGNAYAQNTIGYTYLYGQGITQNYEKAFNWFLEAANQGSIDAQYNIESMNDCGLGHANL